MLITDTSVLSALRVYALWERSMLWFSVVSSLSLVPMVSNSVSCRADLVGCCSRSRGIPVHLCAYFGFGRCCPRSWQTMYRADFYFSLRKLSVRLIFDSLGDYVLKFYSSCTFTKLNPL